MKLSDCVKAFLLDKRVAGCSPNTIRNYSLNLDRLQDFLDGDPELADIAAGELRAFFDQLMTARFEPRGVAKRPARTLSAKTIKNAHTCLCSLWTWAIGEGYATTHVPREVDIPKPEKPVVEPFTVDQVKALLANLSHSLPWEKIPETQTERPRKRQLRDRAIILLLLDTGIRATELCELTIDKIDLEAGSAKVSSKGRLNRGEGKERTVRFSPSTSRAIRRYLSERDALDRRHRDAPLFTDRNDRPFARKYLAKHLKRLGERAGVDDVHAHRFRHTFAINYLRNGGDIYTLQDLLGHTSLEMVRRYLHIAQVDVEEAHRRASPVENWRL
jgi:integrase/recombinase XerD